MEVRLWQIKKKVSKDNGNFEPRAFYCTLYIFESGTNEQRPKP